MNQKVVGTCTRGVIDVTGMGKSEGKSGFKGLCSEKKGEEVCQRMTFYALCVNQFLH